MRRRELLAASVSSVALASAGCLGYEIRSTDDIQSLENTIEEQQTQIDDLQAELESREERITELESEIESLEQDIAAREGIAEKLEEERESAVDRLILNLYSRAIGSFQGGIDKHNSAIEFWGNRRYRTARAEFNVAAGLFRGAELGFGLALRRAREYSRSSVQGFCQPAESKAQYFRTTDSEYQEAAAEAAVGNTERANDIADRADSSLAQGQAIELARLGRLEEALGTTIDT